MPGKAFGHGMGRLAPLAGTRPSSVRVNGSAPLHFCGDGFLQLRLLQVLVHPVGPAFVDVHLADGVAGRMACYGIGEKLYGDAVVL